MAKKIFVYCAYLGCSFVLAVIVIELGIYLVIKAGWNPIEAPSYDGRDLGDPLSGTHYRDLNPHFCTWHKANWSYLHIKSGFREKYLFNNIGARDKERSRESNRPRAIILGDSFVEGWLLQSEDRLSNLLEESVGAEVMNFGTAGYVGPLQYYLIYKHLASSYDHSLVFVGLVPVNDFQDNDLVFGQTKHRRRFRPYLVGQYPNYEIIYYDREFAFFEGKRYALGDRLQSFVINFSMLYRTALNRFPRFFGIPAFDSSYSGFYDFSEDDWQKLSYSLERLIDMAGGSGSRVLVFTIPVWGDVVRFLRDGPAPLSKNLNGLATRLDFTFVDLLDGFVEACAKTGNGSEAVYWIPYDSHWSSQGNRLALELLKSHLPAAGFIAQHGLEQSQQGIRRIGNDAAKRSMRLWP